MGSIANREDAFQAISVARSALLAKDIPKAEKFAHKARRLYPCDEVSVCVHGAREWGVMHTCALCLCCKHSSLLILSCCSLDDCELWCEHTSMATFACGLPVHV